MTTGIVDRALELAEQHGLRGYDAVQLASVLVVHADLAASGVSEVVFISADADLYSAQYQLCPMRQHADPRHAMSEPLATPWHPASRVCQNLR
jgi:predicted nucleic acid-binding protein